MRGMRAEGWIALGVVLWVAWALVSNRIVALSVRGTLDSGVVLLGFRVYARVFHRLTVEGAERVPRGSRAGPLIVVCNHTSGVDPILVQAVCPFEVTWTMAHFRSPPRSGTIPVTWSRRFPLPGRCLVWAAHGNNNTSIESGVPRRPFRCGSGTASPQLGEPMSKSAFFLEKLRKAC